MIVFKRLLPPRSTAPMRTLDGSNSSLLAALGYKAFASMSLPTRYDVPELPVQRDG
jgi:hypothetical protein